MLENQKFKENWWGIDGKRVRWMEKGQVDGKGVRSRDGFVGF